MLEVKDVPVQAGLDLLRTLRSGFAPGIDARGTVNGSLMYDAAQALQPPQVPIHPSSARRRTSRTPAPKIAPSAALQGTLTIEKCVLSGGGLKKPLAIPKTVFVPEAASESLPGTSLSTHVIIPIALTSARTKAAATLADVSSDLTLALRLGFTQSGYQAALTGSAPPEKVRELAYAFGLSQLDAMDGFAGGVMDLDLKAAGPWISSGEPPTSRQQPAVPEQASSFASSVAANPPSPPDSLTGSIQLRRTQWQAPYLARPVNLSLGTVTISAQSIDLASDFTYGSLKGMLAVTAPSQCRAADCKPEVQLRFGSLDAVAVQTALLGAPEQKTLLSPLMDRMRSTQKPAWPAVALGVSSDSLILGPVTLRKPFARLHFDAGKIVIESLDATVLDGAIEATGSFEILSGTPKYAVKGSFTGVNATQLGTLLGGRWIGSPLSGTAIVNVSGADGQALAASAKGSIDFDWPHGAISTIAPVGAITAITPPISNPAVQLLTHFDRWNGTLEIDNGEARLGKNEVVSGPRHTVSAASIRLTSPPKFAVTAPVSPAPETHAASAATPNP